MPPSVLVVTPGLVALVIFMRRYYIKDPRRRVTDPNFLAALASVGTALGYVWIKAFDLAGPAVAYVFLTAAWALLAGAAVASFRRPPAWEQQPGA